MQLIYHFFKIQGILSGFPANQLLPKMLLSYFFHFIWLIAPFLNRFIGIIQYFILFLIILILYEYFAIHKIFMLILNK